MAQARTPIENKDWKKRESFGSAITQVIVVGLLLAGAVFWLYQRGAKQKETAETLAAVRTEALKDNPTNLEKALGLVQKLVDDNVADALAVAADLETERWLFHRVPGAEQKARDLVRRAEAAQSKT